MQGLHLPCWQNLPGGPPDADRWQVSEIQTFHEAEQFLDLLERCGVVDREVLLLEGRLAVRWRAPAGEAQSESRP
jgi:hypothetical protein